MEQSAIRGKVEQRSRWRQWWKPEWGWTLFWHFLEKGLFMFVLSILYICIVYTVCMEQSGDPSRTETSVGSRENNCTVCRQKSRHSWSAEKDIPPKKCQKNILYCNLWRNVILNDIKRGHPCWQYLCNQSKAFQYNNHQSECFLEWIDEESQIYQTLSFLFISCTLEVLALYRAGLFIGPESDHCLPLLVNNSLTD